MNKNPSNLTHSPEMLHSHYSNVYPTLANPSIPIPKGRIIDDSSRGILFWEVVEQKKAQDKKPSPSPTSDELYDNTQSENEAAEDTSNSEDESSVNNWTLPFEIEWMSKPGKTVPFYKVRHLKNPYNQNRPVKIAHDGTEIEPSVGQQIISLFKT